MDLAQWDVEVYFLLIAMNNGSFFLVNSNERLVLPVKIGKLPGWNSVGFFKKMPGQVLETACLGVNYSIIPISPVQLGQTNCCLKHFQNLAACLLCSQNPKCNPILSRYLKS